MSFLYLLEGIRTPFLDTVLGLITYVGDEIVFLAIALTVYWCISKRVAYYLLSVGFFGTLINQFAKIVCQVPRPWVRDPDFTIVESARAAATGYSFPSGHTANVSATLGCCAVSTKKRWLRVVCAAAVLLVSFSRMYLGVHYPSDVLFSLGVSIILVFGSYPLFKKHGDKLSFIYLCVAVITVLSLIYVLYVTFHDWGADIDAENLASAEKNGWLLTGCGAGMIASLFFERKYVNFDVKAPWWAQILKVAIGLGIAVGIKSGLKALFLAAFGPSMFTNCLRYLLVVVFAVCIWPMTFPWFAAGCPLKKKR